MKQKILYLTRKLATSFILSLFILLLANLSIWPYFVAIAQEPETSWVYVSLIFNTTSCQPNLQEAQIVQLMKAHEEQGRPELNCNTTLAKVARARAEDMAVRGYFGHVNPDGYGPNYLVREAGYVLPDYYDTDPEANNVESIAAGYDTVESVWEVWLNSSAHRTHILGLNSFYAEQVDYGIGYVYNADSDYKHYWVIITAKSGLE